MQTYPNRELLILADGEDVRDLVPETDCSIRLVHLDRSDPIGDKRNFGCERARGELIAHWDDDDYSAPERLADQVVRLRASAKAVTGYRSMRFQDEAGAWWQYRGAPESVPGTTLCYRRDWWESHRFPCINEGEDVRFAIQAYAAGQLDQAPDAGNLMYATIHSQNTSPRPLTAPAWVRILMPETTIQ